MKRIVKIVSVVLVLSLCLGLVLCLSGCNKKYEYGDFYYYIDAYNNEKCIAIGGLTEQGKKKEKLIIPDYINDIPVKIILGAEMYGPPYMHVENAKEIIFGRNVSAIRDFKVKTKTKLICYNAKKTSVYKDSVYVPYTCVVPYGNGIPANISFMYNYEGAENNGFYVVDNEEVGSKIEKPIDPTREGYTFGGWYKDKECTIAWDFDNDTTSEEVEYDVFVIEGTSNYTIEILNDNYGTLLYAKWN